MDNPRLSVVIPSYNSAAYIEATLYSLAKQECKDFEVIVVDGRSMDDSAGIATHAISKYNLNGQVILFPASMPGGVAANRNLGIQNAEAEWISFLDSDDLFFPAKIGGTLQLIQKYGASCHAYYHGIRQFEDGTNKVLSVSTNESDNEPKDISPELIQKNIITTSSVTIKKTLLEELGGFDNNLQGVEDYLMWLRAAKKTKWFYSRDIWTDYRVRSLSLMGGREMTHYIKQNANLLESAKGLNEFTKEELSLLEHSLFDHAMQGYALISLNTGGWNDFMKGLVALSKMGKLKLASLLFMRHFKNLVLRKLHRLINQKKLKS